MELIDIEAENKEIVRRYRRLYRSIKPYFRQGDAKLIRKAFNVSLEAHKDMRRKSGEPYIYHPIEVSQIVVDEINLGPTAVAAALLHDVVEDTDWELEDIEKEFGTSIAKIIDGVTKLPASKDFEIIANASQQAENFRKMLLAISDDVRVILIKLADRLHNMRTLGSMARNKQLKIASETMYIYAPLAHRLGLYKIKSELEDLYLKYTHESIYREIAYKLKRSKTQRDKFIKEFIAPIEKSLEEAGFEANVFGRPKSIYSIWNKMKKQNIPFEEIYDLFAIRIVIDTIYENEKPDCWRVYSLITDSYKPNPDRLRDWVSTPRANGYESLHTTVMGPEGRWVEVQIRTKRMDEIAEKGYAAHWKYKEKQSKNGQSNEAKQEAGLDAWLRIIRELREQNQELTAVEFINEFRANFFNDEVFIFTPKGDLKTLPLGATALDFAFEIHSEVGNQCLGVKVNQKLVPINHVLKNGDQVEIITSKKQKPNADWLKYVSTAKARTKINDYLKTEIKDTTERGKEMLEKKLHQLKVNFDEETIKELKIFFETKKLNDLMYNIGKGYITVQQITKFRAWKLERKGSHQPKTSKATETVKTGKNATEQKSSDTLVIGDQSSIVYSLAPCCNPIPGDDIFGFTTINEGIRIHRIDCPNAISMLSKYGHRVIKAIWKSQEMVSFLAELKIIGTDRIGLVRDVTKVISSNLKVNIAALEIGTKANIFEGIIKLYVHDAQHLEILKKRIGKIEGVVRIERVDLDNGDY